MSDIIDLGHDHALRFFEWAPDRDLNPQYDGIADDPKAGAIIEHPRADNGEPCAGSVSFDTPTQQALNARQVELGKHGHPLWQIESWEPLTISPSVLCSCGDHGYIREGRWVPA